MGRRIALAPAAWAVVLAACALPEQLPVQAMPAPDSATCPRVRPVSRVRPVYPRHALDARQDGWVLVEFDLPGDGVPLNPRIFLSSPPGLFDESALRAVAKFRYPMGANFKGCLADLIFTMR